MVFEQQVLRQEWIPSLAVMGSEVKIGAAHQCLQGVSERAKGTAGKSDLAVEYIVLVTTAATGVPPLHLHLEGVSERIYFLMKFGQLPFQPPNCPLERGVVLQCFPLLLFKLIQSLLKPGDFSLHARFHQFPHCLHSDHCSRTCWHGKTAIKPRAVNTSVLSQSTVYLHLN